MDYQAQINQLITDHFPWGEDGKPFEPDEPDERRKAVEAWIEAQTDPHRLVALALFDCMRPLLDEIREDILKKETERLVWRLDSEHLVKSPESILEKMVRSQVEDRPPGKPFDSLCNMNDLGRFRIVVNFLSDMEYLKQQIEGTFGQGIPKSSSQECLGREFLMIDGIFKDSIAVDPKDRKKGERCLKGLFHPKVGEHKDCKVEVQIQTLLQEAWDKKDHYLFYEPRRRGNIPEPQHEREIFAMSELLYVADLTFDRIRKEVLDSTKRGASDAR